MRSDSARLRSFRGETVTRRSPRFARDDVDHPDPRPSGQIATDLRGRPQRVAMALTLDHLLEAAAQTPLGYGAITKPVDAVAKAIGEAIPLCVNMK